MTLSIADFDLDGYPEVQRSRPARRALSAFTCTPNALQVLLPLRAPPSLPDLYNCQLDHNCIVMLHNDGMMRCDDTDQLKLYVPSEPSQVVGQSHRLVPVLADATMAIFIDLFEDGVWDILAGYPDGKLSCASHLPSLQRESPTTDPLPCE